MAYFSDFNYINYEFPDGVQRLFKNLTFRADVVEDFVQTSTHFEKYLIQEGETPESIAYDRYEDVNLHWAILLVNQIQNVYTQWPKSEKQLDDYLNQKYRTVLDSDLKSVTLTDAEVYEYVNFAGSADNNYQAYQSNGVLMKPHHFVDDENNQYSFDTAVSATNVDAFGRTIVLPTLTPVSIRQHEEELENAKRQIMIPKQYAINKIKDELRALLNA